MVLCICGIPFFGFGIINTLVSLKYETEGVNECISLTTSYDLCLTLNILKGLTLLCTISLFILIVFKQKLIKTRK